MTQQPGRPVSHSVVQMTELVLPSHTNALGTIFGGIIMSWVDIAAAICAQRHSSQPVVTASIDALNFVAPVHLGWVVNLRASLNYAGKTSMEVGVRVDAENPITGEKFHTASAYLTFVALGSNGKPRGVPPVLPESADEKRRFAAAQERRRIRLEARNKA
jgi:acyl-CoA hydrolase